MIDHMQSSIFGVEKDVWFMKQALKEANKAYAKNEVPVGAILVNSKGAIIARGFNLVEKKHSQSAHAEICTIEKAGKKIGDWRLNNCWLYVTLEPCNMCLNLIILSRIQGLVYGASSPLFGFRLDNTNNIWVYKRSVLTIVRNVEKINAGALLKLFFQKKRKKSE